MNKHTPEIKCYRTSKPHHSIDRWRVIGDQVQCVMLTGEVLPSTKHVAEIDGMIAKGKLEPCPDAMVFRSPEDQRTDMAVSALSGIASADPGSVKRLVEAAKIIDAMPVDGCSPSVIESMLRQAKSLVYAALAAIRVEGGA